jgi:hypothetical protein
MDIQQAITKAIEVHNAWRADFRAMVDGNGPPVDSATVGRDNLCELGRWLSGPDLTEAQKNTAPYEAVRILHVAFHRCAGEAADLIQCGQADRAQQMFSLDGDYSVASDNLVAALEYWARSAG